MREILDEYGIKAIALGGLLTNICIESAMRTALDMGFEVYTLTDCAAALSEAAQRTAIGLDWPMFSKPVMQGRLSGNAAGCEPAEPSRRGARDGFGIQALPAAATAALPRWRRPC
ncbi:MAG: isochorismatase family protein [Pseudomonadota bacterium]